ncbi:Putative multidrug export ATP-binding/permease protein SAV1866 [Fusobacterium polymorphum]|uniref:Phospholipid-lipopolysaccharide ABC superfamily ATP binding cassette transporter ABC protein n=1 Tax=Fusobacterium polymorphum ATCC 10953 TaxID=393480 RepID=A5TXQ8_FUSNP|nr:ABC transporter ATP-binding protein [Fusobacterium polymorphum]EDK89683.1 phospholipid-lipopolysaccharide ABC superfamily ATP binding cassette transporter ABC protein [Fusobacterium polymorphum ATCC 10953]UTI52412.1 ABC transporter ATP-binding protein/permease [Fusobacterium polymorphum]WRL69148.1 ABC transporter ATP-binding protein [Fusobacterium polymorphum]CKH03856.1 Putative multidrug export ATP-binding/permease protein SAV1866 [Fusobacterium polymorphum]
MKILKFKNKSLNVFLGYSYRYKWHMIAVIILSTIASAMSAIPAWLSKKFVDDVLINQNKEMFLWIIGGIFVATVIKVVSSYYSEITSNFVTETIKREIKIDIFSHLEKLPISYFKKNKLGDTLSKLTNDTTSLGRIGFIIFDMFKELLTVLILTGRMFQVDYILALVSLILLPLIIRVVRKYTKKIRKYGRERQDTTGKVTAFTQETLSGIFVIKAFNNTDFVIDKYKDLTKEEFEQAYKTTKIKAKVSPINEVITTFMVLLVVLYGGYQILVTKKITSGDLISFVTALGLMHQPLKRLISKNNDLQDSLPSADRVVEIFDEKVETDVFGEAIEFDEKIQDIKFENVNYKYEDSNEYVLKNINLDVKAGEIVAFVGKSGSGKTTLVNLLARFFNTDEGTVKVNGVNIKNIPLKIYRNKFAIVPQETFLFGGTIKENISFGKEVTDEEIISAAKMANAYNFIQEDLPNKFETEVGERGALLSGGQKQRIAIARALIKNPEIMILDEATSALDSESEKLVQEALDSLMEGRTTFVIAHRLSTIVRADKIVVMENGEIKEMGTHSELIAMNGIYKNLYDIQFNENV